jgi:hypothetical protein
MFFPASAKAQSRDYLTNEEIELVRDAQEIDKRIDILVKAIDRRFLVLNKDNSQEKQIQKDLDKWGELPTGTETELLSDISRILQKAVDDIDDLVSNQDLNDKVLQEGENSDSRDEEVTKYKIKTNKKQFPIAVHTLADASRRYLPIFEAMYEKVKDKRSQGLIYGAVENCNLIIEASSKVPKYTKEDKKKKKDKN